MTDRAQLALELSPIRRWGGRRTRAGRKRSPRSGVPHARRPRFSRHTPCHVTLRVRRGVPSLRAGRVVREIERSLREACERETFRVVHYSLQCDHVHLLVEAEGPCALARGMKSIGARIARAVNRVFARRGPVLAERFHHRVLRTPREVRNALRYVLLNFRKHAIARGVLDAAWAVLDSESSARWFAGWAQAAAPPAEPPPVAAAKTWLLRVGWRWHGTIDAREVPGTRQ
jgi:REP element-mobilizing transposase RayT